MQNQNLVRAAAMHAEGKLTADDVMATICSYHFTADELLYAAERVNWEHLSSENITWMLRTLHMHPAVLEKVAGQIHRTTEKAARIIVFIELDGKDEPEKDRGFRTSAAKAIHWPEDPEEILNHLCKHSTAIEVWVSAVRSGKLPLRFLKKYPGEYRKYMKERGKEVIEITLIYQAIADTVDWGKLKPEKAVDTAKDFQNPDIWKSLASKINLNGLEKEDILALGRKANNEHLWSTILNRVAELDETAPAVS